MENNQPTIEQLLKNMEKISGGDPRPIMKAAKIAGVSKEEIAEAIMTAREAKAATIFAAAVDGFEALLKDT
jgi:hypothetical protein